MQRLFFMHRVVEPFGNDVRKKEKKNMCETILKRTKTCHESRIWEKLLTGEGGRLQRED
jgi:hypothetical protein